MPQQAQVKGKETGTQRCAQEQRRDRRERRKTKDEDERPKHHAVRANKYGQAGLEPRHSDITPCQRRRHVLEAGEKNGRERKREKTRKGRKTHKPRKLDSMAGKPEHASTKTNIDLDVIVQLNSSSPAASSKRSSTDSFSNPKVWYTARSPTSPQLCQALGQLRNSYSPLCMPPRTARRQGPAPVSCHDGHFLLRWLRGDTTTASTNVDWHYIGSPRRSVILSTAPMKASCMVVLGTPAKVLPPFYPLGRFERIKTVLMGTNAPHTCIPGLVWQKKKHSIFTI